MLNLTVWPQEINNVRLNNLIIRDISQKKLAEQQLIVSAFTDSLTGLSNRANFTRVLAEQIKEGERTGKPFFLLVIDLDKFKEVNDSFGHDYGDRLLKAASKRLLSCVRDHDLVSRMGDEFTIVLREIDTEADLLKVAQRILRTFRREFAIRERRIFICQCGHSRLPTGCSVCREIIEIRRYGYVRRQACGQGCLPFVYARNVRAVRTP